MCLIMVNHSRAIVNIIGGEMDLYDQSMMHIMFTLKMINIFI